MSLNLPPVMLKCTTLFQKYYNMECVGQSSKKLSWAHVLGNAVVKGIYVYVCMYVCIYVCYVYIYIYINSYIYIYIWAHVLGNAVVKGIYVCMYVYIYMYLYVCLYICVCVSICTYMYIYYVCIYTYICIYIMYVYINTYINKYIGTFGKKSFDLQVHTLQAVVLMEFNAKATGEASSSAGRIIFVVLLLSRHSHYHYLHYPRDYHC
jgi:hypothetical protein